MQQDLQCNACDQDEYTMERSTPVPSGSTWASPLVAFRDSCSTNPEWLHSVQQFMLVVGGNDVREGATSAELLYDILALIQECGSVLVCMASVFPQA